MSISELANLLASQRSYCGWLIGHPCRWFVRQQEEYLEEIEQAYRQLTAELE